LFCFLFIICLSSCETIFHAEDCNFVVEGIPSNPYSCLPFDYKRVQSNMKLRYEQNLEEIVKWESIFLYRRDQISSLLGKDEYILTVSAFPRYYF